MSMLMHKPPLAAGVVANEARQGRPHRPICCLEHGSHLRQNDTAVWNVGQHGQSVRVVCEVDIVQWELCSFAARCKRRV